MFTLFSPSLSGPIAVKNDVEIGQLLVGRLHGDDSSGYVILHPGKEPFNQRFNEIDPGVTVWSGPANLNLPLETGFRWCFRVSRTYLAPFEISVLGAEITLHNCQMDGYS